MSIGSIDTVHFIIDGASGDVGGGCTKTAWDADPTLTSWTDADGSPLCHSGSGGTGCVLSTDDGWAHSIITEENAGDFDDAVVGAIAHCYREGHEYFEITDVDTGAGTITVKGEVDLGEVGQHESVECWVGGAFGDIATATTDVPTSRHRIIYTNADEDLSGGKLTWTWSGSVASSIWLRVIGFKTNPGDMSKGGTYYGGALDALREEESMTMENSSADWVRWHGGGTLADDLLLIDNMENITFENIHVTGTSGDNNDGVVFANTPVGISFINCRLGGEIDIGVDGYDVYYNFYGAGYKILMEDCFFSNTARRYFHTYMPFSNGSLLKNCVFSGSTDYTAARVDYATMVNCLFYEGARGLYTTTYGPNLINCVFYNQTTTCVNQAGGSVMTRGYNNIFSPAAAADYAVYVDSSGGTVYHDLKNNCVYSANASSALTNEAYNSDRSAGFDLTDSITQDPEFTDAANADFTVRNALLLQGGDPDAAGNATQVGMVQRKYRPSISGRRQTSNLAALSIFR